MALRRRGIAKAALLLYSMAASLLVLRPPSGARSATFRQTDVIKGAGKRTADDRFFKFTDPTGPKSREIDSTVRPGLRTVARSGPPVREDVQGSSVDRLNTGTIEILPVNHGYIVSRSASRQPAEASSDGAMSGRPPAALGLPADLSARGTAAAAATLDLSELDRLKAPGGLVAGLATTTTTTTTSLLDEAELADADADLAAAYRSRGTSIASHIGADDASLAAELRECSALAGDCAACLGSGCAWQLGSGACEAGCLGSKQCFSPGTKPGACAAAGAGRPGSAGACDAALAAAADDDNAGPLSCAECVEAGCVFQGGACKPACEQGGGPFIPGGCVDLRSQSRGLTCPDDDAGGLPQPHPQLRPGYCSAAPACSGEPHAAKWCQRSAGHCVTSCRSTWCPTDGFCTFGGCRDSQEPPTARAQRSIRISRCDTGKEQCESCEGGEWCPLYAEPVDPRSRAPGPFSWQLR